MTQTIYQTKLGEPHPLGAVPDESGVNFSIFSEHASAVELLLFDKPDALEPFQVINFDPDLNRTFFFWHIYVEGLKPNVYYAYRLDGSNDFKRGFRFNKNKLLLDPYATGISQKLWNRVEACGPDDNSSTAMRGLVLDSSDYDWEGDRPLGRPMAETIIYEMHVGGFTKGCKLEEAKGGTFAGIIEKIPYLQELGITAVELMPIFQFDSKGILREVDGKPLVNYWGYSTIGFFALHDCYCSYHQDEGRINEFRDMVKALHKAGIEVILDVVFNHTDEGNQQGPTFAFRGLDNTNYYYLTPGDEQYYYDYSGCGNTLNCNHPIVSKMILDCLKYWVREMHVDGFRFDEGTILARGEDGAPMKYPPILWTIEFSDELSNTKMIAEAWDAAGLDEVGNFPGYRWAEWNGLYRDTIRRFVKGDPGLVGQVASRLAGSADLYQAEDKLPLNSINFITAHDGFTLNDLVSYNYKHNEANGEGNRDGVDNNLSWNCGYEGEVDDLGINSLRERQLKNFASLLMLSRGVPMFVMGDEIKRTQQGNNNAYCQDNEISWFDWSLPEKNRALLRYWQKLISFRRGHSAFKTSCFFNGKVNARGLPDISWHGCSLNAPGWYDPNARALAFTLAGFEAAEPDIHVMLNMFWEPLSFELPEVPGRSWYRFADTYRGSPDDVLEAGAEVLVTERSYQVGPRSVVILISKG